MIAGAPGQRGAGAVLAVLLLGCGKGAVAPAHLVVRDARAFEARMGGTAAAYVTIVNGTDSADVVDSVTTPLAPAASMHAQQESNGLVTMTPLDRPVIGAHDSLVLAPGGNHLMLEGVTREFRAGDSIPLTFWFQRAGRIEVSAGVSAYGS